MGEHERGCGWRKIGGVYLVGEGVSACCDGLPVDLGPCDDCGFEIYQARSIVPHHAGFLHSKLKTHECKDDFNCPLCFYGKPWGDLKAEAFAKGEKFNGPKEFYLMWVSQDLYTPEEFISEASALGVSKRIAANSLPSNFVIGKDWIFLAHRDTKFKKFGTSPLKDDKGDPVPYDIISKRGIFYAFKPERLELVLYKGQIGDDELEEYEEAGYRVVLIDPTPENKKRHGKGNPPPIIQRPKFAVKADQESEESGDDEIDS